MSAELGMTAFERVRRGAGTALAVHLGRTSLAAILAGLLSARLGALASPLDAAEASQWLLHVLEALRAHGQVLLGCAVAYALIEPGLSLLWLRAMSTPEERGPASRLRRYLASLLVSALLWVAACLAGLALLFGAAVVGRHLPPLAWLEDAVRWAALLATCTLALAAATLHDLARAAVALGSARALGALAVGRRQLSARTCALRLLAAVAVLACLVCGEALGRSAHDWGLPLLALVAQQTAAFAALVPRALWLATALLAIRR
jgi:hypothetical protein